MHGCFTAQGRGEHDVVRERAHRERQGLPVHTLADLNGQRVCPSVDGRPTAAGGDFFEAVTVSIELRKDAFSGVVAGCTGDEHLSVGAKSGTVAEVEGQLPGVRARASPADQKVRLAVTVNVARSRQPKAKAGIGRAVEGPCRRLRHAGGCTCPEPQASCVVRGRAVEWFADQKIVTAVAGHVRHDHERVPKKAALGVGHEGPVRGAVVS